VIRSVTRGRRNWPAEKQLRGSTLLVGGEGLGFEGTIALLDEDLDLAFGFIEFFFAGGGEAYTFFKELDGVFEGEITFFEVFDDAFEFLEGFFEGWHSYEFILYGLRIIDRA
jgi:hypothetical protein